MIRGNHLYLIVLLTIYPLLAQGQNLDAIFKKHNVNGSITILDLNTNQWIFSDKKDAYTASLPASTFKILNSCIALQTKVVKDEYEEIEWDRKIRTFDEKPIDAWNRDTDMKEAFKNSTVWFYVEMAKRIGRKKYKKVLNKINYGNNNFSEKGVDFWNYGNFAVTPAEQILMLKKLYKNNLPFDTTILYKVKNMMITESNKDYTIRSKTGWTNYNGKDIGWNIGYLSTKDNVYFFANRITKPVTESNKNFGSSRKDIVFEAFLQMEIITNQNQK